MYSSLDESATRTAPLGAPVFEAKVALRNISVMDFFFSPPILKSFYTPLNHVKFLMNFANVFHKSHKLEEM